MAERYPDLSLALFRFVVEAQEPLYLPAWKGSALRGGLGHRLKRAVCVQPQTTSCDPCPLVHNCAYSYLFETRPPPGSEVLRTHRSVPVPFVLRPPLDARTVVPAGERIAFGLVLIGRAVHYLSHFLVLFRDLGMVGLGRKRGKYALREVWAVHPLRGEERLVYDGERLKGTGIEVTAEEVDAWAEGETGERLTVRFLTPTRLKHAGVLVRERVEFHVLVRALLRRLSSLAYFHSGRRWETDYSRWIAQAERVRVVASDLRWEEWGRFSGRQRRWMEMGGLVGQITWEGDLAPFRGLLALGMLTHVGKGTVFGNGQYDAIWERASRS